MTKNMPRRRVGRSLLVAAAFAAALAAAIAGGRFGYERWKAGLPGDAAVIAAAPACPCLADADRWSTPKAIAHAAGAIGGRTYTNSLEALEASTAGGFRFVELDLRKTLGGGLFAAHDVRDFNKDAGAAWRWRLPPTAARVHEAKLPGGLTPMTLEDAERVFAANPALVLVTDKADDFEGILEAFPHPERLIVEVRHLRNYAAALEAGVLCPALNTRDFRGAAARGVRQIVTTPEAIERDPEGAAAYRSAGGRILAATLADCAELDRRPVVRKLATLVYADVCRRPEYL